MGSERDDANGGASVRPRVHKINAHRSFEYYTPEDVERIVVDRVSLAIANHAALPQAAHLKERIELAIGSAARVLGSEMIQRITYAVMRELDRRAKP